MRAQAQDLGATLMSLRRTAIGKFDVAPDYEVTDIYDVYTLLKKELQPDA